jgi:membrane protein DedA with SNARE-associated domain
MPKLPKISMKLVGQWAAACVVAAVVAATLGYVASEVYAVPAQSIRAGALNVASLFVAYLLLAGIGRKKQKDKS